MLAVVCPGGRRRPGPITSPIRIEAGTDHLKKLFHFDAPREQYRCDAAIIWCFDNRFELGFRKFLKHIGVVNSDPIKIAGGAKCLASPDGSPDREFVIDQIRKSIHLHQTSRVILMVHSDCGAYGGLRNFGGDLVRERQFLKGELQRASANVREAIPNIEVDAFYVDFEGVWEPQIGTTATP